jgi:predicted HTH transcriptional regulator
MPRNTLLAQVFYYGELLEKWDTGTSRMIALSQETRDPGAGVFRTNQILVIITAAVGTVGYYF